MGDIGNWLDAIVGAIVGDGPEDGNGMGSS